MTQEFNIHDFAHTLLKLPVNTSLYHQGMDGGDKEVISFGIFKSVTENPLYENQKEEWLELIEKGLLSQYYIILNPNIDTMDITNPNIGYVVL